MSSEENPEKEPKRKLIVDVQMNTELQKAIEENAVLREKIKEQEEIQSQIALETFERVKSESANAHPAYASSIRVCTTPEALEGTLARIQDEEKSEKERNYRAPSGKSTIGSTGQGGEQFDSKVAMVDELYKRAFYEPSAYSKDQVVSAKKQIESLLESMITGPSWSQLKERGKISELMKHNITACPECGATKIDNPEGKCDVCGYSPSEKGPRQTRHYKGPETRS